MLVLLPIVAWILAFIGWDSFRLPVEFDRLLTYSLLAAALGCAYPLRQIFRRAQPLGWGGKLFVFTLVILLWFSALAPLAIIMNVKFDQSLPERLERSVLEIRPRGAGVCVVRVPEWKAGEGDHWLWLDCRAPASQGTKVSYELRRGALGFAWISSNASGM